MFGLPNKNSSGRAPIALYVYAIAFSGGCFTFEFHNNRFMPIQSLNRG